MAGNYIADADKLALDTSHAVFANILDPGYPYPGDSSVCRMEFSTPLARFSRSTAPTRDILETPFDTSTIGDDPAALISRKMGRDVYPFPSPSTISSTPSRASTLAMELQPSTGGTPFPTPKEVEAVKRQVLQTTPPSRTGAQQEATTPRIEGVQPLAATPQGMEGVQPLAATPQGVEGAQQVAATPQGVEGAQQVAMTPLSGSGDRKRKAEEGQEQTKREKMETIEEEEEDGVKLVPLQRPEEEDIEEILKYV